MHKNQKTKEGIDNTDDDQISLCCGHPRSMGEAVVGVLVMYGWDLITPRVSGEKDLGLLMDGN